MSRTLAKVRRLLEPTEHMECVRFVMWANLNVDVFPELDYLAHIPNEGRTGGRQGYAWGAKMRAEGLRAGFPDYVLPIARDGKHSLYIEAKRLSGTASAEQKLWGRKLIAAGHEWVVAKGSDAMVMAILSYLAPEAYLRVRELRLLDTRGHVPCPACGGTVRGYHCFDRFSTEPAGVVRRIICRSCSHIFRDW